ncbi:MAG: UDP-glucose 6-dehydrogenase [Flavobacteriaceae bacterium]|nr:UDP-glucose 6-dehydrogenase [Flavobacteriaceae bacterium]
MNNNRKITVVGSGYVGMSLSVLLSVKNDVIVFDIDESRVKKINKKISTIADKDIDSFLKKKNLSIFATTKFEHAISDAEFIIIATPTNYDHKKDYFDTSTVDNTISNILKINSEALIVIKSTLPIGHTDKLQKKYNSKKIIFSPEFLREGKALWDNLYPSRIIIGSKCSLGKEFAALLEESAYKKNIETIFIGSNEAESVKLFSNAYLSMRVSFFNELDNFCIQNNLNPKDIIDGVCLDERIGDYYNNPSFGYGGYCLPKDTKQLVSNYKNVPKELLNSINTSNEARKDFLVKNIIQNKPKVIGIFRLAMKNESDNYRESAILGIIERIQALNLEILIYEPKIKQKTFMECVVVNDLIEFKDKSEIIVANRKSDDIADCDDIVFTRDLYQEN